MGLDHIIIIQLGIRIFIDNDIVPMIFKEIICKKVSLVPVIAAAGDDVGDTLVAAVAHLYYLMMMITEAPALE